MSTKQFQWEHRTPTYQFQLAMVSFPAYCVVYCSHITHFHRLRDWGPQRLGPLAVAQSAPPLIRHWSSTSCNRYFDVGEMETSEQWIMNPYSYNLDKMPDDRELKEDLVKLRSNRAFEMQFASKKYGRKLRYNCAHSVCYNILNASQY